MTKWFLLRFPSVEFEGGTGPCFLTVTTGDHVGCSSHLPRPVILQGMGQPHTIKNFPAQNVSSAEGEKPGLDGASRGPAGIYRPVIFNLFHLMAHRN